MVAAAAAAASASSAPAAEDDKIDLTIAFFDGQSATLRLSRSSTIATVKRRLAAPPTTTLCCNGAILTEKMTIAELPAHATLSAWSPRYSRHRSENGAAMAEARRDAGRAKREAQMRQLLQLRDIALDYARGVSWQTWAAAAVFLLLLRWSAQVELALPFLFVTTLLWFWKYGFQDRKPGEESPFTVFNYGMRALPGQMNAQELERNLLHGM